MGNCLVSPELKEGIERDKQISKYIHQEKKSEEVKLLLLGAGESGKSTIAKQMKILHMQGFTSEEKNTFKSIIFKNITESINTIISAAERLGIEIEDKESVQAVLEFGLSSPFTPEFGSIVSKLWKDPGVVATVQRSSEFQLNDSAPYYFDNLDRISDKNYIPSEQDMLRSRVKTTGIIEIDFKIEKAKFKIVDVGGQRSERRKWMHCFEEVTAVLFVVAMSEYDLKLYEDDSTNRMRESLKLFKEVCNSKWFMNTSMILFLNKKDVFEEKIKHVDLNVCFPEYQGGMNFDNASKFMKEQFVQVNNNPKKHIYVHLTCATDTENVQVVFNAVKDIVLHKVLDDSGLGF